MRGQRHKYRTAIQGFQPLLAVIASASDCILAQQLGHAQAELKIMRTRLPQRIVVTPEERAIVLKHGRRWVRKADRRNAQGEPAHKIGRSRKSVELRALVGRIVRETGFGYG